MARKKVVIFQINGEIVQRPYQCLVCKPKSYYGSVNAVVEHTGAVKHKNARISFCSTKWCVRVAYPSAPAKKPKCLRMLVLNGDDAGNEEIRGYNIIDDYE